MQSNNCCFENAFQSMEKKKQNKAKKADSTFEFLIE